MVDLSGDVVLPPLPAPDTAPGVALRALCVDELSATDTKFWSALSRLAARAASPASAADMNLHRNPTILATLLHVLLLTEPAITSPAAPLDPSSPSSLALAACSVTLSSLQVLCASPPNASAVAACPNAITVLVRLAARGAHACSPLLSCLACDAGAVLSSVCAAMTCRGDAYSNAITSALSTCAGDSASRSEEGAHAALLAAVADAGKHVYRRAVSDVLEFVSATIASRDSVHGVFMYACECLVNLAGGKDNLTPLTLVLAAPLMGAPADLTRDVDDTSLAITLAHIIAASHGGDAPAADNDEEWRRFIPSPLSRVTMQVMADEDAGRSVHSMWDARVDWPASDYYAQQLSFHPLVAAREARQRGGSGGVHSASAAAAAPAWRPPHPRTQRRDAALMCLACVCAYLPMLRSAQGILPAPYARRMLWSMLTAVPTLPALLFGIILDAGPEPADGPSPATCALVLWRALTTEPRTHACAAMQDSAARMLWLATAAMNPAHMRISSELFKTASYVLRGPYAAAAAAAAATNGAAGEQVR